MDTQTAISTLQAMLQTLESNITGLQAQSDALNLAVSQLQGILETEIVADQAVIADLQDQVVKSEPVAEPPQSLQAPAQG